MTIKHLFPVSKPTLNLNFAAERSLDPRITFTRSSIGTYVDANGILQTAVNDEPRFDHDPATGESLGLLLEESRTNLLPYSEQFDNAAWATTNMVVTPNNTVAPDGTTTADTLTATAGGADIYDSAPTSNVTHINSVWIKRRTGTGQILIRSPQGQTDIDITSQVTNEWKRISSTATLPFSGGTLTFAGVKITVSGDEVDVWGIQSEIGSFPTSYIPTSGSTVTRPADLCSILGTNYTSVFGTTLGSGSIFTDVKVLGEKDNTFKGTFSSFGTSNNSLFTSFTTYDNRLNVGFTVPGANIAQYYDLTGVRVKSAVSWTNLEQPHNDLDNASHVLDGVSYGGSMYAKNGSILNTDYDRFGIGRTIRTSTTYNSINGHISRLSYYPRRLTDTQLEALTS